MRDYKPRASSKVERAMLAELEKYYPDAQGDALIEGLLLAGKHLVFVDVFLSKQRLVVEYDGAYWHQKRSRADVRKTKALLRAGYRVIRVREQSKNTALPLLDLEHDNLRQLQFSPDSSNAAELALKLSSMIESMMAEDAASR